MGRLDGKVALVTGSGRGMGKAIALLFAKEGADVVVNSVTPATMEATAAEIKAMGRKAIAVKADVSKKDEVDRLVATAVDAFKRIDILVNNAGITRYAPFLEMTEKDWDEVLAVDAKGVFLCTQAVARHMVKQKYGKVVNITSLAGMGTGREDSANYTTAKAGANALTKIAASALGPYGINVNAIAPGSILTDIIYTRRTPEEVKAYLEKKEKYAVLGRNGTVADIANLALFLASDESSFITGQIIPCDGGRTDKM